MKTVVVIGGGFAGSKIAKKLEKHFDVTLIDTKDYFEYTPGILRAVVEPYHVRKIQALHSHYLKRARIIIGNVSEVNKKYVKVNGKKVLFDYLCICSGSKYDMPIKQQNVVAITRAHILRDYYKNLCMAKKILVVGGGLVGVELAAEICTHYKDKEITLIHMNDRLIERNPEKASVYCYNFLYKRGVKIIFNEKVDTVRKNLFFTNSGSEIKVDIAFLCTGIKPNFEMMKKMKNSLNERNQINVNEYLQLNGFKNIFSAGDVNSIAIEKTALNSKRQARVVIHNILALENETDLRKYSANQNLLVISLGKWDGLVVYKNLVFSGFFPGIFKTIIEKWNMIWYK